MNVAEATAFQAALDFAQAIGVGFGDIVILLVLFGAFWLIVKGKIKIGNGNGHSYVQEGEFRADMKDIRDRFDRQHDEIKALRGGVQEVDRRLAKVETQVEQFRSK